MRDVDVKTIAEAWAVQIERALRGIDAEIDLSVDVAKAKKQIEAASKDQKSKMQVDADTEQAKAKVQLLDRDIQGRRRTITYHVDIDKNQLQAMGMQAGQMFGNALGTGAEGGSATVAALGGVMKSLSQSGASGVIGVTSLAAAIVELTGVAAAATGVLGLLPAVFTGIGAGAGVLKIGLSGITDALDAASAAHKSAGKDATDHARTVQSAARSVTSAQQSLNSAVKSETAAQKDVARARRDALRELQDINDELRNGAIDETQAQIDLAKAREELATGTFESSLDYQQAQLNVIKNEQRLKEAHEANVDLDAEAADKRAKGVDQADQVVAAEERLATAQQNTANAQQALADAQTRLAEANNETSTSAQKAADAMSQLSPNAQALVNTLLALQPVWQTFRNSLQDPLTANLGPMLVATIDAVLPAITPGLQRIATAFNTMFMGIGAWLQDPENLAMIQVIIGNIATAFENLAPAVGPLLDIFATLTDVGSSFLPGMASDLADIVQKFSEWVSQKAATGELAGWIQMGLDTVKQFGPFLVNLVNDFMRLAPIGEKILPDIIRAIEAIADLIPTLGPLLVALGPSFGAVELAAKMVKVAVEAIKGAVEFMWKIIEPIWEAWKTVLDWIVDKVKWLIDHIPGVPSLPSNIFGSPNPQVPTPPPGTPPPYSPGGPGANPPAAPPGAPAVPGGPAPAVPGGPAAAPGFVNPQAPVPNMPGGVPLIPDPTRPGFWTSSDPTWAALIKRESGGNPTATQRVHDANWPNNLATGLFQITKSTWLANGGGQFAQTAREASPQQQAVIAANVFRRNPSGSDWGAGPGRESPAGLAAGLPAAPAGAPAAAAPAGPSPAPPAGPAPAAAPGAAPAPSGAPALPQAPAPFPPGNVTRQTLTAQGVSPLFQNPAGGGNPSIPQWVQDFVKYYGGPSLVATSTPHGALHGESGGPGWAVDVVGDPAEMDRLAKFLEENPQASAMMIHQDVSGEPRGVLGGQAVAKGTVFTTPGGTYADEATMVHWAPSSGGMQPSGPGGTPVDSHVIPLQTVVPPGQQAAAKDSAKDFGKDLGQNIISGMMEIFGFGDLFKDPTEFGLFKLFKGFMGLKPASSSTSTGPNAGPTNAANGTSTGNPLLDLLGGLLPSVSSISAPDAAGPAAAPSLGNTVTAAALAPPPPSNIDNSNQGNINLTMENAPADEKFIMDTVDTTLINNGPNRSILRNKTG